MTLTTKTRETRRPDRHVLFPSGSVFVTVGAITALSADEISEALVRHLTGDWGDVSERDWLENDAALDRERRLLSAYEAGGGKRFWIITEADRSRTTVLLPNEY
jgi:hypothetical protein